MIAQNLIEAFQAHTRRVFRLVVTNLRSAPDALNKKGLLWFSLSLIHVTAL